MILYLCVLFLIQLYSVSADNHESLEDDVQINIKECNFQVFVFTYLHIRDHMKCDFGL